MRIRNRITWTTRHILHVKGDSEHDVAMILRLLETTVESTQLLI